MTYNPLLGISVILESQTNAQ